MRSIDLNCDLGEGCENDAELMKYLSSANVACGFHAGDEATMATTVELAIANAVAIGAHPGYRDRENFGRTSMALDPSEVFDIVIEQIGILGDICRARGARLHHVKPHGALYNQAAKDPDLAAAIAEAVAKSDNDLMLYGLSGSELIFEAGKVGLATASEVFADRTYRQDGSLTPRSEEGALIHEADESIRQVLEIIESGSVTATSGEKVPIRADTICLHGDGPHAVEFAVRLRKQLDVRNVKVESPGGR